MSLPLRVTSLVPSPDFHVTSPERGSGQMGSAESACLVNATPNQITGLLQVTGSPGFSHGECKLLPHARGVLRRQ